MNRTSASSFNVVGIHPEIVLSVLYRSGLVTREVTTSPQAKAVTAPAKEAAGVDPSAKVDAAAGPWDRRAADAGPASSGKGAAAKGSLAKEARDSASKSMVAEDTRHDDLKTLVLHGKDGGSGRRAIPLTRISEVNPPNPLLLKMN